MTTSKQIFDFLPGVWKLSRQTLTPLKYWQNSGAECIKAIGFAAIIQEVTDSNLLIYSEKVTICNPNESNCTINGMEARQKYKYRFDANTSTLTKYFYDDRLFYTLNITESLSDDGVSQATTTTTGQSVITVCGEHLCIQDNYVANYLFKNNDSFVLKYSINGPKKCYEIVTEYEKCTTNQLTELGVTIENGEIV